MYDAWKKTLEEHITEADKVAIEMHRIPDPDCITGALALKENLEGLGISADITYGGRISHPQNIVLVKELNVPLVNYSAEDNHDYTKFIFVDHSGSNSLWFSEGKISMDQVVAIFDHHALDDKPNVPHLDKRKIGSTATIIAEYLSQGGMDDIDEAQRERVATGLYLGIRSDTKNLVKNATRLDHDMHSYVFEHANMDLVYQLENIELPDRWIDLQARAVSNRHKKDGIVIASVGEISEDDRDVMPIVADYLINTKGFHTAYVFCILPETISASIRTKDKTIDYQRIIERFPHASGEGKDTAGGFSMPNPYNGTFMDDKNPEAIAEREQTVRKQFIRILTENS